MIALSIVDYIHNLKQAGVNDQQSEVHARQLVRAMADVKQELKAEVQQEFQTDELVVKADLKLAIKEVELSIQTVRKDLELSIEKMRYDTLKFVIWTGVGVVVTLTGIVGGMLARGFHWF